MGAVRLSSRQRFADKPTFEEIQAMNTRRQGVAPNTARPAPSNSATTIASKAGAASERSSRNTPQAKAQVNSAGRGQTITGRLSPRERRSRFGGGRQ